MDPDYRNRQLDSKFAIACGLAVMALLFGIACVVATKALFGVMGAIIGVAAAWLGMSTLNEMKRFGAATPATNGLGYAMSGLGVMSGLFGLLLAIVVLAGGFRGDQAVDAASQTAER